jgi:hypothetical protein
MKQALQKLIAWIVVSSADPNEVSLTVKGALVAVVPTLMAVAGFAHINLGDGSLLTSLVDGLAQVIQVALTLVATAMAVWGTVRKVYYLIVPKNGPSTISQS